MVELKKKTDKDLSVIILSYNTKDITLRCLEKVKLAKKYCEDKLNNKIEVIVLDNDSKDGSQAAIKSEHPWVKLIASIENLGFSKGNNFIMQQVQSPFILLLNSDVYLQEDSLYKTVAYFRVNLNCDVMGAKLTYSDGRLQPSAGNLPTPKNLIPWIFGLGGGFHPKNKNYFARAHKVGWVMGAFFALRKKVFEKTNGFDENLFMHMEEVEWCQRIKKNKFNIWYNPQIEVIHLHGASTNFDLSASFLNEIKGMKYFLKKHYNLFYYPLKLILILGLIFRSFIFFVSKKEQRSRIYFKGIGLI